MLKSLQNLFLILKNLELHKAQFEILQKIKKTLHTIKESMKTFLTFKKNYFQIILTCLKNEIIHFLSLVSIPQLTEDQSRDLNLYCLR